jgi:hypothetical protein
MPDKRTHRGPHPEDGGLFGPGKVASLRSAVADVSLLLTKGYAPKSSLKLVGDRFALTDRQRMAVMRCMCSDEQVASRRASQVHLAELSGQRVAIDGYNLLITVEAALSGGVLLLGRDQCCRDLASVHGSYRKVTETIPAIELIGSLLSDIGIAGARWLFDSPVSNSGRLKGIIYEVAEKHGWPWEVELQTNPDTELMATELVVATSDSNILDNCSRWVNLASHLISHCGSSGKPAPNVINLSSPD